MSQHKFELRFELTNCISFQNFLINLINLLFVTYNKNS